MSVGWIDYENGPMDNTDISIDVPRTVIKPALDQAVGSR